LEAVEKFRWRSPRVTCNPPDRPRQPPGTTPSPSLYQRPRPVTRGGRPSVRGCNSLPSKHGSLDGGCDPMIGFVGACAKGGRRRRRRRTRRRGACWRSRWPVNRKTAAGSCGPAWHRASDHSPHAARRLQTVPRAVIVKVVAAWLSSAQCSRPAMGSAPEA
jgi:hypothetical protein